MNPPLTPLLIATGWVLPIVHLLIAKRRGLTFNIRNVLSVFTLYWLIFAIVVAIYTVDWQNHHRH